MSESRFFRVGGRKFSFVQHGEYAAYYAHTNTIFYENQTYRDEGVHLLKPFFFRSDFSYSAVSFRLAGCIGADLQGRV